MSRKGVWQLRQLAITYCDFSGSSRGAREFVQTVLPDFKGKNPQLKISDNIRRGHHPWLDARYVNGSRRTLDLKNRDAEEILRQAQHLRNSAGRKASLTIKKPVVSPGLKGANAEVIHKSRSIQGVWRPGMFDSASTTEVSP
eukprot:jgi/Botrbrau1/3980/Bobra.0365s0052.1